MRAQRSMKFLIVAATLGMFAACSSVGGGRGYETSGVSAQWDSGPLDQDYRNQRTTLDARHQQENSNPSAAESADQRSERQSAESKDLDTRYAQGKASHAQAVPSSGDSHGQGQSDKSHQ
jgi:hypothetical protein